MKWLIALAVTVFAVFALAYVHGRAMRRAYMWGARTSVSAACQEYLHTGIAPIASDPWRIHVFTNSVKIDGTAYSCALATDETAFSGAGVLAITTNQVCIWFDKTGSAKIIDTSYWPPLFPSRF